MTLSSMAVKKGEDFVMVPLENFLTLPLTERVRWILQNQIRFYDEMGNEIPLKEGARMLREIGANGAALPSVDSAGVRTMGVKEFMALPVSQRVALLLEKRVRLQNERGEEVSVSEAIRLAREV